MSRNTPKKYPLHQSRLFKCGSMKKLSEILQIDLDKLKKIDELIYYSQFTEPKKDGTPRTITAPNKELKRVQKRILFLLSRVHREDWLISGEKGKSYIDNAKAHQFSKYVVTMDIRGFYDNCFREYVYKFFLDELKTPPDIAKVLTDIATFDKKIPTGCPTSQLLSYYAYHKMFSEINDLCLTRYGCKFTLYVDDMTFSSEAAFRKDSLIRDVDIILRKYGHKPKYSKLKYYNKNAHKLITGTVITFDNDLQVPNSLQNSIVIDTKSFKSKKSIDDNISKGERQRLHGRIQAARRIDKSIFPEVKKFAKQLVSEI